MNTIVVFFCSGHIVGVHFCCIFMIYTSLYIYFLLIQYISLPRMKKPIIQVCTCVLDKEIIVVNLLSYGFICLYVLYISHMSHMFYTVVYILIFTGLDIR